MNETAIKQLNIEGNVLGQRLRNASWGTKGGVIIGVVQDFNQESLKNSIVPLVYNIYPVGGTYLSLRINSKYLANEVDWIRNKWKDFEPDREMEYFFMDDYFTKNWLNNYAFKTTIDGYIFVYTMLSGILIAVLTLSYRVVKVARSKPVDSLKMV